jgi:hypothetical protein
VQAIAASSAGEAARARVRADLVRMRPDCALDRSARVVAIAKAL